MQVVYPGSRQRLLHENRLSFQTSDVSAIATQKNLVWSEKNVIASARLPRRGRLPPSFSVRKQKGNSWATRPSLCRISLLHTSYVSKSASARTFTLEHKRHKQGGSYIALTIALTFCRFTLEDFWHKRNRKRKTSTRKTKFFHFLALAITFFSIHTIFFCVAIAIALALTSLVWSRL